MAWEQPLFSVSFKTAKDLSARQWQVVRLTTAGRITFLTCGAGNPALGILQDAPTCGMEGNVMIAGISKVKAAGAVGYGGALSQQINSTSYPGMLVAITTAMKGAVHPVGRALQAAAQAGDIIPAIINFFPQSGNSCAL